MVRLDFGITESIAEKIRNYGTAVVVGVFIGTALTTGLVAGVAGWWAANKTTVVSEATRLFNDTLGRGNQGAHPSSIATDNATIEDLSKRVKALETSVLKLSAEA